MPYLRSPSPRLLWCPSDRILPRLLRVGLAGSENIAGGLYPYSYTLNCTEAQRLTPPALPASWTHGMASAIRASKANGLTEGLQTPGPDGQTLFYFKATSVTSPSGKIVFADNRKPYEMTEKDTAALPAGVFDSSAWYWPYEKLTKRHGGKGNVTLADGHVETVRPEFAEKPEHYDPLY